MLVIQPPAFVGVTEAGSRKHTSSPGLPAAVFLELSPEYLIKLFFILLTK